MAEKTHGIQSSVLEWARKSQGYSIEEVALHLKRDPSEILEWESESGKSTPTYAQLETLAYTLYKRPIAIFFLPAPPKEPDLKREFRTLPDVELDQLAADTRYQLRIGQSFQLSLRELNEGANPCERQIFRDVALSVQDRIEIKAEAIREYLGLTIEEQSRWRNPDFALKTLRRKIEDAGVFVFKHAFKQKEISGFCLRDDEFPIIYLNNSTAKTRQIFSLFHELAHLLLHLNGISKVDFRYIDALPPRERRIEQFCNAFAAEALVPSKDFSRELGRGGSIDDQLAERLAKKYSVSREVIFRRMLDRGLISKAEYQGKAKEWADRKDEGGSGSGGNYYATQGTYLGERYLQIVFGKHYQGKLSLEQVADYLGVKTGSVARLEPLALGKGGLA